MYSVQNLIQEIKEIPVANKPKYILRDDIRVSFERVEEAIHIFYNRTEYKKTKNGVCTHDRYVGVSEKNPIEKNFPHLAGWSKFGARTIHSLTEDEYTELSRMSPIELPKPTAFRSEELLKRVTKFLEDDANFCAWCPQDSNDLRVCQHKDQNMKRGFYLGDNPIRYYSNLTVDRCDFFSPIPKSTRGAVAREHLLTLLQLRKEILEYHHASPKFADELKNPYGKSVVKELILGVVPE
jgi:hypothetical protein